MVWQPALQCTELMPLMDDFSNSLSDIGGGSALDFPCRHVFWLYDLLQDKFRNINGLKFCHAIRWILFLTWHY
jgi:hypothetical protein